MLNKKRIAGSVLMGAAILGPLTFRPAITLANSFYANQSNADRADITNWVANTPTQIANNIASQHINTKELKGDKYVIQWGDTLSGISAATGISVAKLAYDNNIHNIDLIYAGDVLILNRDGKPVPTDYHYVGTGLFVAFTKVTINNYIDNSTNVNINVSPIVNNNFTNKTTNYQAPDKTNVASEDEVNKSDKDKDATLSSDEFTDQVKSYLQDKMDDVSLGGDDSDSTSSDDDAKTEDAYSSDQSVDISGDKMNDRTAEKVADKIIDNLKSDGKMEDLKKADSVDLDLELDGDNVKYNFTMTTADESSDESSDTSSDESSDDSSADDQSTDSDKDSDTDSDDDADVEDNESEDTDTHYDDDSNKEHKSDSDTHDDDNNQADTNDQSTDDSDE